MGGNWENWENWVVGPAAGHVGPQDVTVDYIEGTDI